MSVPVGERLRTERAKTGLNQEAFARAGGVSRKSQVDYESGKLPPNTDYLEALAAIGVDIGYVLTGVRHREHGLSESDEKLIEAFHAVEPVSQEALRRIAYDLASCAQLARQKRG